MEGWDTALNEMAEEVSESGGELSPKEWELILTYRELTGRGNIPDTLIDEMIELAKMANLTEVFGNETRQRQQRQLRDEPIGALEEESEPFSKEESKFLEKIQKRASDSEPNNQRSPYERFQEAIREPGFFSDAVSNTRKRTREDNTERER